MQELKSGSVSFFISDAAKEQLSADLFTAEHLQQLFDAKWLKDNADEMICKGGRGLTLLFTLYGRKLVLRRYLRGGLWGKLIKEKFCRFFALSRRALLELELIDAMLHKGLPVPPALIAREERSLLWRRNALISLQVPDSQNLAEVMAQRSLTEDECRHIGETLARFFNQGVLHTDLNIRNILLNSSGQCLVIDFDKCFLKTELSPAEVVGMLSRLQRSFLKEQGKKAGLCFKAEDFENLKNACITKLKPGLCPKMVPD